MREIERKFLVIGNEYKTGAKKQFIKQGFLSTDPERVVRVRIASKRSWLTLKSKNIGSIRKEFEYQIPIEEANEIIALCIQPIIEKIRYKIQHDRHIWEVDEFMGANEGLVIAEVELSSEDEILSLPKWVGTEVTDDPKYYNNNLITNPYSNW